MVKGLGNEAEEMRQKCKVYDIFHGKKPWDLQRKYDADYLELDSNPNKAKYIEKTRTLFQTYGDTTILFADYILKLNRYGKAQKYCIVVTDHNVYKQDPKNFKVDKFGTPIINIAKISMSPYADTIVVMHCTEDSGMRDIILNLGINNCERCSEFVAVLDLNYKKLTDKVLPIHFSPTIMYNNSRTKVKAGVDEELVFESANVSTTTFVKGKKRHVIQYPA